MRVAMVVCDACMHVDRPPPVFKHPLVSLTNPSRLGSRWMTEVVVRYTLEEDSI